MKIGAGALPFRSFVTAKWAWYRLRQRGASKTNMAQIGKFTQPDVSPKYFIEFLEFLDKREDIRAHRAETAKQLNLVAGSKVLDLGCGIGGATFPLAEITGPTGLAAGVDISAAMIEARLSVPKATPGLNSRSEKPARFRMPIGFLTPHVARECFCIWRTGWRRFARCSEW